MRLLLAGANGQTGRELVRVAKDRKIEASGMSHDRFDLTDPAKMKNRLEELRPDIVINAAAFTDVDGAEKQPEAARAVNRDGAAALARLCHRLGAPLIHISTDYVFDGNSDRPYLETDPPAPLGIYGRSKMEGESALALELKEHIIVRTSWVYGVYGRNFLKTMIALGRERAEIGVVSDQSGCPTAAHDLAGALLDLAAGIVHKNMEAWGIYHYRGQGQTTWYDFAVRIFELAARHEHFRLERVRPIGTADYPTPAARPRYSVLDCAKIERVFGLTAPPWEKSLAEVIERLYPTLAESK